MVALTFPDGARREYPDHISGLDIAKGISPSLARRTVAMALDGTVTDLADPVTKDAKIEFLTREDPRALELIRHDCAHVLAEAVQTLWPGTQVTIGPVIENGFYYDFFRNQPFTPEDFAAIEKKMAEAGFWDNQEKAQATIADLKALNALLKPLDEAISGAGDLQVLLEMAGEDPAMAAEVVSEVDRLEEMINQLELKGLLSGPFDSKGAILTINARDGGTDANDWAEMMLRMYADAPGAFGETLAQAQARTDAGWDALAEMVSAWSSPTSCRSSRSATSWSSPARSSR